VWCKSKRTGGLWVGGGFLKGDNDQSGRKRPTNQNAGGKKDFDVGSVVRMLSRRGIGFEEEPRE